MRRRFMIDKSENQYGTTLFDIGDYSEINLNSNNYYNDNKLVYKIDFGRLVIPYTNKSSKFMVTLRTFRDSPQFVEIPITKGFPSGIFMHLYVFEIDIDRVEFKDQTGYSKDVPVYLESEDEGSTMFKIYTKIDGVIQYRDRTIDASFIPYKIRNIVIYNDIESIQIPNITITEVEKVGD